MASPQTFVRRTPNDIRHEIAWELTPHQRSKHKLLGGDGRATRHRSARTHEQPGAKDLKIS